MPKDLSYDINILLKQVADEDEQVFRLIFEHYRLPFYTVAFKMTHSADIAEDITQEVFVAIWVKRKLVASAKNPDNYVFAILHNCVYSHFRRLAKQHKSLSAVWIKENSEDNIETMLIEKENRARLENAINHLPPQQKLIYKLTKQDGMCRNEIARELNISPNTVKNHLSAAVNYIKSYLKKDVSALIWVTIFTQF